MNTIIGEQIVELKARLFDLERRELLWQNLEKCTVEELKTLCKECDLSTRGTIVVLMERIMNMDEERMLAKRGIF
jgi:hypothetical protein